MKPTLSEFSFGYALTEGLIKWRGQPLASAPYFPSLLEEGGEVQKKDPNAPPGFGYDVALPFPSVPIFLQFKLSDYMVSRTAIEARDWRLAPPYYRIYPRSLSSSNQHQLLLDLESKGYDVFYAAPAFHTMKELNDAYVMNSVVERTVYFRPRNLKIADYEQHYVSFYYQSGPPRAVKAWRFSEPEEIEAYTSDTLAGSLSGHIERFAESTAARTNVDNIQRISPEEWREFSILQIRSLANAMENIVLESDMLSREDREQFEALRNIEPVRRVGYLARMYFGCEPYQVGRPDFVS